MRNIYPVYRDVKDWAILDEKIIHDYTPTERPIKIVLVLIGTLHYDTCDFNSHNITKRTPIMRWLTYKEYRQLRGD